MEGQETLKKIQAVITNGGVGRRLIRAGYDSPKALQDIGGISVLAWQLRQLASQGITRVLITVGSHRGSQKIMSYFGDGSGMRTGGGKPLHISVSYYEEHVPLGECGALLRVADNLEEDFFLINGDTVFAVDLNTFLQQHQQLHAAATILTHPDADPAGSRLVIAGEDNRVQQCLTADQEKPEYYRNCTSSGIMILNRKVVTDLRDAYPPQTDGVRRIELDRDILQPLCAAGSLYRIDTAEYAQSICTAERFAAVKEDIVAGRVLAQRLIRQQRAVFLMWDALAAQSASGEGEPYVPALRGNAAEAIRMLRREGFRVIVVRGSGQEKPDPQDEERIARITETLLGKEGTYPDAILSGKPAADLIADAERQLRIDMLQSYIVCTTKEEIDMALSTQAGPVLIGEGAFGQEVTEPTLLSFAGYVRDREKAFREELEKAPESGDTQQASDSPEKAGEEDSAASVSDFVKWLSEKKE